MEVPLSRWEDQQRTFPSWAEGARCEPLGDAPSLASLYLWNARCPVREQGLMPGRALGMRVSGSWQDIGYTMGTEQSGEEEEPD